MKIIFHPEALAESREAAVFYTARQSGLGLRFLKVIQAALVTVVEKPTRFRIYDRNVRRCSIKIFPYSLLYVFEDSAVYVVAVMHNKRKPGYWKYRLPLGE